MRYVFTFFTVLLSTALLSAQPDFDPDEKLAVATDYIEMGENSEASRILREIIAQDSTYVNAYLTLGDLFYSLEKFDAMVRLYEKAARINGNKFPLFWFLLANCRLNTGDPQNAESDYKRFLASPDIPEKHKAMAESNLKRCEISISLMANPVPFHPVNLGPEVNSALDEYLPSLTADEQMIVITRMIPDQSGYNIMEDGQEDFYFSVMQNGKYIKAKPMGGQVNTSRSEGAQTLSADGKWLYFTACGRSDGYGDCDIYVSKFENGQWSEARNMGQLINSPYWDSQPSVSADGNTLYFTSRRTPSQGSSDIWVTTRDSSGKWTKPVNMGLPVNTSGTEKSPYIHYDNKTFYFCSSGHPGLGGYDLFVARKNDAGQWTEPDNLGFPINTPKDEMSLVVNSAGDKAYYASARDSGYGLHDIYYFELYAAIRPMPVVWLRGKVTDNNTGLPLFADCFLFKIENGENIHSSKTIASDGTFMASLPVLSDYGLHVSCPGYMFFSGQFALSSVPKADTSLYIEVKLEKIVPGKSADLKNIFYDTDSYQLNDKSLAELKKLQKFLMDNPSVMIEIEGHTDNQGTPDYNLKLSENRARIVYEFLLAKSISPDRLTYKGYGQNSPVEDNSTEAGRAKNRRTVVRII